MKKKALKIVALVAALVLLAGLAWFANGLNGNPVSKFLAKRAAANYLTEHYAGTDYQVERVAFNFKDGNYHAFIVSPCSVDTHFSLSITMLGKVYWDTYESVTGKFNTAQRLEEEYRELVDDALHAGWFPFACDIGYGTLAIYPPEALADRVRNDIPEYAMDQSLLVVDGEYDIRELAAQCGHLVIYIDSETVTVEETVRVLRELDAIFAEKSVPFAGIDLVLWKPKQEEGPREDVRIDIAGFRREWISDEDLAELVREADAARKAWYAEQDKLK